MALRPNPPHRSRRIERGVKQPPRTPRKTRHQEANKRDVNLLEMVEAAGIEPATAYKNARNFRRLETPSGAQTHIRLTNQPFVGATRAASTPTVHRFQPNELEF